MQDLDILRAAIIFCRQTPLCLPGNDLPGGEQRSDVFDKRRKSMVNGSNDHRAEGGDEGPGRFGALAFFLQIEFQGDIEQFTGVGCVVYIPEIQVHEGEQYVIGQEFFTELHIEGAGCADTGIGALDHRWAGGHKLDGAPGADANTLSALNADAYDLGQAVVYHPDGPCGACLHAKNTPVAQGFADTDKLDGAISLQGLPLRPP